MSVLLYMLPGTSNPALLTRHFWPGTSNPALLSMDQGHGHQAWFLRFLRSLFFPYMFTKTYKKWKITPKMLVLVPSPNSRTSAQKSQNTKNHVFCIQPPENRKIKPRDRFQNYGHIFLIHPVSTASHTIATIKSCDQITVQSGYNGVQHWPMCNLLCLGQTFT